MKQFGLATLLALGTASAQAGEGRVLFVCETANAATCELAAQRFEAQSRAHQWHLAGRAATVEGLDADRLALAMIVVTIDAALYRRWLLSIRRLEAWDDNPPAARDIGAATAAIDRRLEALGTTFANRADADAACPARDYACFMAKVATLREGLTREEVEKRLGAPTAVSAAEPVETWRDTLLSWSLHERTEHRPPQPAWHVEVSLAHGRVVHVRTIGWLES